MVTGKQVMVNLHSHKERPREDSHMTEGKVT